MLYDFFGFRAVKTPLLKTCNPYFEAIPRNFELIQLSQTVKK